MIKVLEWAFSFDTPFVYGVIALILLIAVTIFLVLLTIFLFAYGMWYIPVVGWIGIPAWILIYQYRKDQS